MIKSIRLASQQLLQPAFEKPEDLVNWMGAVQAQDYTMAKWALGVRLNNATLKDVEKALRDGKILRTHILRPTWHFISAEDIRWMIQLSGKRIKTAFQSYGKSRNIDYDYYVKSSRLLEKILSGKSLTKQEINDEFNKRKLHIDITAMNCLLTVAETEGIICSGIDNGKKATFALLEERVAPAKKLNNDEALARLAKKYFQSHSPASLNDFVWWSGLNISEARKAIDFIKSDMIVETFAGNDFFVHKLYKNQQKADKTLHLLPSFDEYLISYKNRTDVLEKEHHAKAFNNYGTFYPVVEYKGKIVGNWKKISAKGKPDVGFSFFDTKTKIGKKQIDEAKKRYETFLL